MKQHSPGFLKVVNEAKKHIKEISVQTLHDKIQRKEAFHLIDVREEKECESGVIAHAINLSKGIIERDIEKRIPDANAEIVVYCSGGLRCALVAESLQKMGYTQVYSLDKGSQGWLDAGYKMQGS